MKMNQTPRTLTAFPLTLLLGALLLSTPAYADVVGKVEGAVKKVLSAPGAAKDKVVVVYNSVFGEHGKVKFFDHNGKKYVILLIQNEEGSRCTLNFDRKWDGKRTFKCYVLNVDSKPRSVMGFQLKKDNAGGLSDDTEGDPVRHGSSLTLGSRDKSYFAGRNFDAGKVAKDFPYAAILLIEDGLSPDEVAIEVEGMAK